MRFFIALFICKVYIAITDLLFKKKSDRVGLIAARLCPDILEKLKKPELVIMVSGTNGKSTTTDLIAKMFMNDNKRVVYNYWGANMVAGHIRSILDAVNIFNKSKVDVCVLECDEITTGESMPPIKPNYMLITNICRDSIRRNAYPDYIFDIFDEGVSSSKETILILNAMDPLSCFLGKENKRVYISANKIFKESAIEGFSGEFKTCPNCNEFIKYDYRHFRHIGKFHCPKCGLTNYEGKYNLSEINTKNIVVNNNKYDIISSDIFNIYNELMIIALFRELGYSEKHINKLIKNVVMPSSREGYDSYKGIKIYRKCGKSQNGTAPSIVFESILKNKRNKELVLIMDEAIGFNAIETITWLYDNDFELLKDKSVKKIILTGVRTLDFKYRLLLAGVDKNKIIISEDYKESHNFLDINGNDIYVIHDVDSGNYGKELVENIKNKIDMVIK